MESMKFHDTYVKMIYKNGASRRGLGSFEKSNEYDVVVISDVNIEEGTFICTKADGIVEKRPISDIVDKGNERDLTALDMHYIRLFDNDFRKTKEMALDEIKSFGSGYLTWGTVIRKNDIGAMINIMDSGVIGRLRKRKLGTIREELVDDLFGELNIGNVIPVYVEGSSGTRFDLTYRELLGTFDEIVAQLNPLKVYKGLVVSNGNGYSQIAITPNLVAITSSNEECVVGTYVPVKVVGVKSDKQKVAVEVIKRAKYYEDKLNLIPLGECKSLKYWRFTPSKCSIKPKYVIETVFDKVL